MGMILAIALAQAADSSPPQFSSKPDEFGKCVVESAVQFARSTEAANVVVDAAIAKCRPILERYVMDAPPNSLASLPSAQEETRRVLIQLARENALVRVLEIRSQ